LSELYDNQKTRLPIEKCKIQLKNTNANTSRKIVISLNFLNLPHWQRSLKAHQKDKKNVEENVFHIENTSILK